ncbi:YxeA family protein [Virgibacillus dakarensis]|uniref:YxeA family protein n=1 Tax=Lentibacillus populi TaxID=1827502 RepID=A0A9W5TV90_9BACI|nr:MULTISPECIES: YxeA family protein [Bacillaceae]MBT2214350.1 YxeA family protein [Virgibacillus dakarensis]MTW85027.1 YxeA family protein [Virgibacillus dakarensis]GGB34188.1 hypothetical protein GCM10011409_09530 [Lentibacillus populi]
MKRKGKRKFLLIPLLIIAILATAIFTFTVLVQNEIADKLNPFLPKTDVYVQINETGKKRKIGDYEYTLTGYDESGKQREVTFTAQKKLQEDAYLRIVTKRIYVETWEEVQYEEMPLAVQGKFK